jgi:hypothetical protein
VQQLTRHLQTLWFLEMTGSSVTLVHIQTSRHHIPEDGIFLQPLFRVWLNFTLKAPAHSHLLFYAIHEREPKLISTN